MAATAKRHCRSSLIFPELRIPRLPASNVGIHKALRHATRTITRVPHCRGIAKQRLGCGNCGPQDSICSFGNRRHYCLCYTRRILPMDPLATSLQIYNFADPVPLPANLERNSRRRRCRHGPRLSRTCMGIECLRGPSLITLQSGNMGPLNPLQRKRRVKGPPKRTWYIPSRSTHFVPHSHALSLARVMAKSRGLILRAGR